MRIKSQYALILERSWDLWSLALHLHFWKMLFIRVENEQRCNNCCAKKTRRKDKGKLPLALNTVPTSNAVTCVHMIGVYVAY